MLSKTDFSNYLRCSKTLWLRRRRPEVIDWPAPGAMEQTRMRDGQAVEAVSRGFVEARCGSDIRAQVTFQTDTLIARADFVRDYDDGSVDIYAVKASTDHEGVTIDGSPNARKRLACINRARQEDRKGEEWRT